MLYLLIINIGSKLMSQKTYTIGEVARMLNISVQLLRLYERKGLLLVQKSPGNQRMYTEEDIERLRCIRTAITQLKISIEGIRRIHALIPCWEYVQCSEEERAQCSAYHTHEAGCWVNKPTTGICAVKECRDCQVYRWALDCGMIKKLIQQRSTVKESMPL